MVYTIRLLQIALICVIGVCGFWLGVLLAYQSDVLEQKLPSVWSTMQDNNLPINGDKLQVKPNYGYQTDQYTPIQPAVSPIGKEL